MTDAHLEEEHAADSKTIFGFWVYLMTDCILFATLFASYIVLHLNTAHGPHARELFSLPYVLTQTIILLISSFCCGPLMYAARNNEIKKVYGWLAITSLLGLAFVMMEAREFYEYVMEGNSWAKSAFLSGFFTLVSTHGLHISVGILWSIVLFGQMLHHGISRSALRRLTCFSMFWHFLDVVWIFIFTIVYLLGVAT
jgi:cytochrome o ubiquinol oxidase subunit 3